jgi:hypothetical protein
MTDYDRGFIRGWLVGIAGAAAAAFLIGHASSVSATKRQQRLPD